MFRLRQITKILAIFLSVMLVIVSMSTILNITTIAEETSEENTVITEPPREHLKEQMRTVYTDAVAAATEAGKTVSKRFRLSSR